MTPNPKVLELLVCPLTKCRLVYDKTAKMLWSKQAKVGYPVRDGIPILLPEEAQKYSPNKKEKE